MHIVIVGAGLSGLAAGFELSTLGHNVELFEAQAAPGGRVQSETIDGHIIDKGFQILLTAYPQAQKFLDYDKLDLQEFLPGALIRLNGEFHKVGDPLRDFSSLAATLKAPVGSIADKAKMLRFRRSCNKGTIEELWKKPEQSAQEFFVAAGFSAAMIDNFLRPLFAGITLDAALSDSSRVIEFVFRMLSQGAAALPAKGMGAISDQLASQLPEGSLHLNTPVAKVTATSVILESGVEHTADAVVLATDMTQAANFTSAVKDCGWKGTTSVWFAAPEPPIVEPILVTNAEPQTTINSLAPMSQVRSQNNLTAAATVAATALGTGKDVVTRIRSDAKKWFGDVVDTWQILQVNEISNAQPRYSKPMSREKSIQTADGIWICGDYLSDPSINGALDSGRSVAHAIVSSS